MSYAPWQRFYIRDTRQVVGNCALWWRPNGRGYTVDLEAAGQFTEAELKRCALRDTDVALPTEIVRVLARRHVHMESLPLLLPLFTA